MGDIEEPHQSRGAGKEVEHPGRAEGQEDVVNMDSVWEDLVNMEDIKGERAQDEKDVEDPEDVEDSEDAERGNPTLAKVEHMGQTKKRRRGTPGRDGGAGTCRRCSRRRRHGAYMRSRRSRGRG